VETSSKPDVITPLHDVQNGLIDARTGLSNARDRVATTTQRAVGEGWVGIAQRLHAPAQEFESIAGLLGEAANAHDQAWRAAALLNSCSDPADVAAHLAVIAAQARIVNDHCEKATVRLDRVSSDVSRALQGGDPRPIIQALSDAAMAATKTANAATRALDRANARATSTTTYGNE
jgi:hypothetical protein